VNVGIAGETVEVRAEVAHLDDLHLAPPHVIDNLVGCRHCPVFDESIKPETGVHVLSISLVRCEASRALG
jgi:hypothetical protein